MRRWPAKLWTHPAVAPTAVLAVILALHMIDNIFNAMINPIFTLVAGGVGGTCVHAARQAIAVQKFSHEPTGERLGALI